MQEELKPGRTLPNGALVLHHDPKARVVLAYVACARGDNGDYVTWLVDDEGYTSTGSYFLEEQGRAFQRAVLDFNNRCERKEEA